MVHWLGVCTVCSWWKLLEIENTWPELLDAHHQLGESISLACTPDLFWVWCWHSPHFTDICPPKWQIHSEAYNRIVECEFESGCLSVKWGECQHWTQNRSGVQAKDIDYPSWWCASSSSGHIFSISSNFHQEHTVQTPNQWTTAQTRTIYLMADPYQIISQFLLVLLVLVIGTQSDKLESIIGPFQSSPLSLIPKPAKPDTLRVIHNFSYPYPPALYKSINQDINSTLFLCTWGTFSTISFTIWNLPPGSQAFILLLHPIPIPDKILLYCQLQHCPFNHWARPMQKRPKPYSSPKAPQRVCWYQLLQPASNRR